MSASFSDLHRPKPSRSRPTRSKASSRRIKDPPKSIATKNTTSISEGSSAQLLRQKSILSSASASSQPIAVSPSDASNYGNIPDYQKIAKAAQALDDAGNSLFEKGLYDKAMHSYTRALKLKRKTLRIGGSQDPQHKDNLLASVATSINNIGYLRQRSGATSEEIMSAYQDSLQIKKEILGPTDLSVGKTLNNIGSVYFTTGQFQNAMQAYCSALHIMELNLGKTHLDVATVHSNIGDVHMAKRELEKARQRYSDALKIRWARLGDQDPKVIRLLEKVAAIEMADTPQKLRQTKLDRRDSNDSTNDEFVPEMQKDLRSLRKEVRNDMVYVDQVKRELALDMVKDKIQMIKGMRSLDLIDNSSVEPIPSTPCSSGDDSSHQHSGSVVSGNGNSDDSCVKSFVNRGSGVFADDSSVKSAPLTNQQRNDALNNVKDRLAKIRERKSQRNLMLAETGSMTGSVLSYNTQDFVARENSSRSLFSAPGIQNVSSRSIVSKGSEAGKSQSSMGSSSFSSSIQELRDRHEKLLSVKDRLDKIRNSCGGDSSHNSVISSSQSVRERHVSSPTRNLAQYLESAK